MTDKTLKPYGSAVRKLSNKIDGGKEMNCSGKLYFYDKGKYVHEQHGLKNLTDDCDICVYSLTPKGEKSPKLLVVKVTLAGCMDRYLDDETGMPERCVVMEKIDYEKFYPANLFSEVRKLTNVLRRNVEKSVQIIFFEKEGIFTNTINANDFFSMDVDANSRESGAEICLRDSGKYKRKLGKY